ncbi:MAG: type IV secretory system conjugative DNA transfer family protein, partial [Ktedonobacteraceae bacterium]
GNTLRPRRRLLRSAHLVARPLPRPAARMRRLARRLRAAHPALPQASQRRRRRFGARRLAISLAHLGEWLVLGRAQWQRGVASSSWVLSVDELAGLWHLLPEQDAPDVAGLERGRARSRPLPPALAGARRGDLLPYHLGECRHAGQVWPVSAPRDVLHSNALAVAATGKGKSTLFAHLARAHLAGHPDEGVFFLEPHGDTIAQLLGSLPASRHDDVTLLDLADETAVVGLNPLDMTQGRGRDKTVENILAVFIAFWQKQRSWGPRTENILHFALLALAEANLRRVERDGDDLGAEGQYTLLEVIPLLQHSGFRHMVLEDVRDPVVLDWWKHYYEPLRQSFRDEMISSIINKISTYAAAKVSRRILGQSRATVRLSDDIRAGRAILVNTASGVVGEEVSALVGATLVGLFQTALAEQIRLPPGQRRRFWVVIDEFQTYLGIDYHTMLAELRKYGGAFALATQSLSYLDEVDRSLKPTVLGNLDQLFAFAMSADDARALAPALDGLE